MQKLGDRQQYLLDWFNSRYHQSGELACGLSEAATNRSGTYANYGSYKLSAESLVRMGLLQEVEIPGKRGMCRGYIPSDIHKDHSSALEKILLGS